MVDNVFQRCRKTSQTGEVPDIGCENNVNQKRTVDSK